MLFLKIIFKFFKKYLFDKIYFKKRKLLLKNLNKSTKNYCLALFNLILTCLMKRAVALDVLRGVSIFGMVFSANIPFGILPAWMYHRQTPPPSHVFNPNVPGITWVDLVLPIFIFCMGVAIPLALNKKIEAGKNFWNIAQSIIKRYFMLVIFAILIAHFQTSAIPKSFVNFHFLGTYIKKYDLFLITIIGFLSLFSIYVIIENQQQKKKWRIIGWTAIVSLLLLLHYMYDLKFSLHRSNIIILLLANVYLFGAFSWYFTRSDKLNRLLLLVIWGAIQITCKTTHFDEALNQISGLSWLFLFRMTHYMLLIIPATIVGDIIYQQLTAENSKNTSYSDKKGEKIISHSIFLLGIWFVVALYNRWLLLLYISTPIVLACFYYLVKKYSPSSLSFFKIAAYMILVGLILEPAEGGIKKDPVTASYLFITGGISILWLIFFNYVCQTNEKSHFVKLFAGAGSNPLLAYVATNWFIIPLMNLTLLIIPYQWLYLDGYHWLGVLRAFILVFCVMFLVALATKKKIRWRA